MALKQRLQDRIDVEALPVRLLGHRHDMSDLLAAADIAVLTSTWEARALVAQELRAGVPLVATAVGGVPELSAMRRCSCPGASRRQWRPGQRRP